MVVRVRSLYTFRLNEEEGKPSQWNGQHCLAKDIGELKSFKDAVNQDIDVCLHIHCYLGKILKVHVSCN